MSPVSQSVVVFCFRTRLELLHAKYATKQTLLYLQAVKHPTDYGFLSLWERDEEEEKSVKQLIRGDILITQGRQAAARWNCDHRTAAQGGRRAVEMESARPVNLARVSPACRCDVVFPHICILCGRQTPRKQY